MAQPGPIQLDLSTLRSDGTGRRPQGPKKANYVQVTRQDPRYLRYITTTLTLAFNRDARLVARHGRHEFIGDLPTGYTLWIHPSHRDQRPVLELYGNPRDGYYRSAERFTGHVSELLTANHARDDLIRASVRGHNTFEAYHAILRWNEWVEYNAQVRGIFLGRRDPRNPSHAVDLPWYRRYADPEVDADRQNPAAFTFTCRCVFR